MQVLSRMIGCHQLMLLNFYPFLQKYVQPHQAEVPTILAVLVQVQISSVNPLIPDFSSCSIHVACTEESCSAVLCTAAASHLSR